MCFELVAEELLHLPTLRSCWRSSLGQPAHHSKATQQLLCVSGMHGGNLQPQCAYQCRLHSSVGKKKGSKSPVDQEMSWKENTLAYLEQRIRTLHAQ